MKSRYFLILVSLFLFSCAKDKLKGDKGLLEGKWQWVKTTVSGSACNPQETPSDLTPATKGQEESVEFIKKGYFKNFINGVEQQKLRIKFEYFEGGENSCSFTIKLDDFEEDKLNGVIRNDTLILTNFFIPVNGANNGSCRSFQSYFVRE